MTEPASTPPGRRTPLIERAEQVALLVLALAVVAGAAWRAGSYWRLGREPLEAVPEAPPTYRVDVNAADWVTLALVPGLGETLARRIVAERDARGGRFDALEDLTAVRGIGEKTLARLRRHLFVGDPDAPGEPVEMLEPP
ncbi:MAG: helix-hairpin-helix domain-containing protein [Phycisphaerae bacterium]